MQKVTVGVKCTTALMQEQGIAWNSNVSVWTELIVSEYALAFS